MVQVRIIQIDKTRIISSKSTHNCPKNERNLAYLYDNTYTYFNARIEQQHKTDTVQVDAVITHFSISRFYSDTHDRKWKMVRLFKLNVFIVRKFIYCPNTIHKFCTLAFILITVLA